jgi:hypothetical protein
MTPQSEAREIKLVVCVRSKMHSSAELTAMLGVSPDESWEIGTPFKFGSRRKLRDSSWWAVVERALGHEDCSVAADRLVVRLRSLVPRFQGLPPGVDVSLRVLVTDNNSVLGLGLDRSHVQFAADIGADIDVSVVVYGPEPKEPR